jgi:hypothetical protein
MDDQHLLQELWLGKANTESKLNVDATNSYKHALELTTDKPMRHEIYVKLGTLASKHE